MTTVGDTFRAMADLFDQPEVMADVALDVVKNQKKRIEQLEDLCRDLYRIAAHEGYIGDGLHNRLVELGFAEGEQ